MEDIDRMIEGRVASAAKKEITTKMIAVCRVLGQPIRSHHGGFGEQGLTVSHPAFPWRDDDSVGDHPVFDWFSDKARHADDGDNAATVGYIFDALNWGQNLEIRYLDDYSELKAYFHGKVVYKEVLGRLEGYVPGPDTWEPLLDRLFAAAKARHESRRAERAAVVESQAAKKAKEILSRLREAWGF